MKKNILALISLLIMTTLLFGCTGTKETPPVTPPTDNPPPVEEVLPIVQSDLGNMFAIANETGDRLITFTPLIEASSPDGKDIDLAIGANGQYLNLEFVKKQDRNDLDTGRVTASNFDNMEGYIYNVLEQKAVPNETYYMGRKAVISDKNLMASSLTAPVALSTDELTAIGDVKARPVKEAWSLAAFADGSQIQIAVFEPQGQNYLMSIILRTKDGSLKFRDYAVVSDGYSVWRVDDGGTIDPKYFTIRLSALTDQGFLAIISWAGFEGENTFLLLEQGDEFVEQPVTAYRYWSPA